MIHLNGPVQCSLGENKGLISVFFIFIGLAYVRLTLILSQGPLFCFLLAKFDNNILSQCLTQLKLKKLENTRIFRIFLSRVEFDGRQDLNSTQLETGCQTQNISSFLSFSES